MDHGGQLLTLALAACAGVVLILLAPRLRVPSVALLLVGGVLLGPEGLGVVQPATLGHGLELVIKIAVAVILFEGGLTLDIDGYSRASKVIVRMLTVGVLVTWLGSALALWVVFDIPFIVALLGGSLVIVTGPTVVSPLLRRLGVRDKLYHVLYWEGVLIDAIGVFVAILCFEWVTAGADSGFAEPILAFGMRVLVGGGLGLLFGLLLEWVLRRGLIPADHANIFVLSAAVLIFAVCDSILTESGILAVIVAGLVLGVRKVPQLKQLKRFKLELTELAIGILFILLSARLELQRFLDYGQELLVMLAVVMLLLRPIGVLLSTYGAGFSVRERAFLSWLAPRGIVAASMASLVGLELASLGTEGAAEIEAFVFAVIGATVIIQGLSAPVLVRLLGLEKPPQNTWLLLGEAPLTLAIGRALCKGGGRAIAVSVDLDPRALECPDGMTVLAGDPLDPDLQQHPDLQVIGNVLAVTKSAQVNRLVGRLWNPTVGLDRCFRWADAGTAAAAPNRHSTAIWTDLPSPGDLAHDLEHSMIRIESLSPLGPNPTGHLFSTDRALFALDGEEARALPDRSEAPGAGTLVLLRRPVPHLRGLVRDALLIPDAEPTLKLVVGRAVERLRLHLPHLDQTKCAERALSLGPGEQTAAGQGVAIPHAITDAVDRPCSVLAVLDAPLPDPAPDGTAIHLVFLVLSPKDRAEDHLDSLAAVAHLASDAAFITALRTETSEERVLALVRERE